MIPGVRDRLTDDQIAGIEAHVAKGNIRPQNHPEFPLRILNYTQQVQYKGEWDDYTTMCRGLIVDLDWNIVARPFPKFFNWGEWSLSKQFDYQRRTDFRATTKMDGSLGIGYWWEGEFHLATRGSFASEQAIRANQSLVPGRDFSGFPQDVTPLFEIVAPWNRIVLQYPEEDLVLLDVVSNYDGHSMFDYNSDWWYGTKVPTFDGGIDEIMAYEPESLEEGFVVTWSDGERAKFKVAEYVRLHRILTGTNSVRVWEALQDNKAWALMLDHTPDEFNQWVHKTAYEISTAHSDLKAKADEYFATLEPLAEVSRKEFALAATKTDIPDLLFAMLDGKDIDPLLWRRVKPAVTIPFVEEV